GRPALGGFVAKQDLKYIGLIHILMKGEMDGNDYDLAKKIRGDIPNLKEWQRVALDEMIEKYLGKRVV
ncbi:MAG: hypothetical protein DRI46_10500, partial [Chloroflexi bacterium]